MDAEHEALNFMVSCPGWAGLYKPMMVERLKGLYLQLDAKGQPVENIYRTLGRIEELKWAISWPENEVDQALENARDEEKLAVERTDARVVLGHRVGADHQGGSE